jgi:hypothetical protein
MWSFAGAILRALSGHPHAQRIVACGKQPLPRMLGATLPKCFGSKEISRSQPRFGAKRATGFWRLQLHRHWRRGAPLAAADALRDWGLIREASISSAIRSGL